MISYWCCCLAILHDMQSYYNLSLHGICLFRIYSVIYRPMYPIFDREVGSGIWKFTEVGLWVSYYNFYNLLFVVWLRVKVGTQGASPVKPVSAVALLLPIRVLSTELLFVSNVSVIHLIHHMYHWDIWDEMQFPRYVCQFADDNSSQWGSETKSRQMFHTSQHFYDVTFSQICSMNIAGLWFYQLDAEKILLFIIILKG